MLDITFGRSPAMLDARNCFCTQRCPTNKSSISRLPSAVETTMPGAP